MSHREFLSLSELLGEHCGIALRESARVEKQLWTRLRALHLPDFSAYCRYLRSAPGGRGELEAAASALATHETCLFREPGQLEAFCRLVLPRLERQNRASRALRLWSAGCATGEEAYTLAMLALDSDLFGGWELSVIGTDLSSEVLAVARKGAYTASSLRESPPIPIGRYLAARAGGWTVRDEVKARVRFGRLNLLDGAKVETLPRFDAVFCRNVLVYFDPPARRRALAHLCARLQPGGFLLLGHAENLIPVEEDVEPVDLGAEFAYRRPSLSAF